MVRWHKHARAGVGLFGIVCAIAVYSAIGERQTAAPIERPARFDPRAILESAGAVLQQFREAQKDYVVKAERQLRYEDGTTRSFGVTIEVRNRGGRDFVVSGREMQGDDTRRVLDITGGVRLTASDGFTVEAEHATFNEADATVAAPGAVTFGKGRMSGRGTGMTYNQTADVLSLAGEARVTVVNDAGEPVTEFHADAAVLSRQESYLALEGGVRALRAGQVLEADRGLARLSDDDEVITFIELRGEARVTGGDAFEGMRAGEIDLDYTDDGATLERVVLRSEARVTGGDAFEGMRAGEIDLDYTDDGAMLERVVLRGDGSIGMRGDEGGAGRQFAGDTLELTFAANALTGVTGRGRVRVDLPPRPGVPGRHVRAEAFEGAGEAGRGLTSVRFSGGVEYREDRQARQPPRLARSTTLRIDLADDAVTAASFVGQVRFDEGDLRATAASAEYDPALGGLQLAGADEGGGPRVADAQIQVEADAIDVTLDGPTVNATGTVKTILRASASGRMPGLLERTNPVNVNADALAYRGAAGAAVYSGNATLWQGETAVRGDTVTVDRSRGDLVVSGTARSNFVFDTGASIGRAPEIRYDDTSRRIIYGPTAPGIARAPVAPAPPAAAPAGAAVVPGAAAPPAAAVAPADAAVVPPAAPAGAAPQTATAQLSGVQGDLRAGRIVVQLARTDARIERLEGFADITIRLDRRVATGDRLAYDAAEERYVMTGIATVPVKMVEECRETIGRTVVFFKSGDRIVVDGNEEVRTQSSRSDGPCLAPAR